MRLETLTELNLVEIDCELMMTLIQNTNLAVTNGKVHALAIVLVVVRVEIGVIRV
jgi:hypothetical protein